MAGDNRSGLGLLGAFILHACIIMATMFSWAHKLDIADEAPPVVPVDLVTLADKTNIAPMVRVEPKQPEQTQTPQPEAPPAPQVTPQDQAEAAPDTAPSEPLVKGPPPPPTIVPRMKPPPPKPEEKKEKFDINNIAALLDKQKPAASPAAKAKTGDRNIAGIGEQNAMTMDLVDSLRNQIAQCWSPPVGAPNPEKLVVVFDLFLNADGSVAQPPQLIADSAAAAASDPFVRAAAEAARRAIYTCAPYKLPANRYSQWREINPFIFDPRQMVGQ
jgi:hypothetical protein